MRSFELNVNSSDESYIKVEENDSMERINHPRCRKHIPKNSYHSKSRERSHISPEQNYGDYNPKRFPLLSTSDKSPKHCDHYETGNIASKIRYESKTELKRDLNDLLSTVKTESRESKNMNLTGSPYLKRKKFRKGNLKNLVNNTSTSVDCEENDISKFTIDELYPITNVMTSRERTYYREEIQKLASKLREKALTNDRLNSANNDFIQKMRFEKSKIKELEERSVKVIEELNKLKIENEG